MADRPRPVRCPVCGKPADRAVLPFCSRRCADVDLGRWIAGIYRLPGPPVEADDAVPDREP